MSEFKHAASSLDTDDQKDARDAVAGESASRTRGEDPSEFSDAYVDGILEGIPLADIAFEVLEDIPAAQGLKKALDIFASVQEDLAELSNQRDHQALLLVKIGTVLTFSLISKTRGGTAIGNLTGDDWKDVYEAVSHYAVRMDGASYSAFIFKMYADYIDASLVLIEGRSRPNDRAQVHALADDLRSQARGIATGTIPEAAGTETCLWLALEAVMKIQCLYLSAALGDKQQLAMAIAQLAFEVSRYQMYAREQEVISPCISRQHELDEELDQRYQAFIADANEASTRLLDLVYHAFSPDMAQRLKGSVELARELGVESEKILDSQEKIDAYFLE